MFLLLFTPFAALVLAQAPVVSSVSNAASWGPRISPGSIVYVLGSNLIPADGPATVAIDGRQAKVIWAWSDQLVAVVPFDLAAGDRQLVVTAGAARSVPFPVKLAPFAPALFSDIIRPGILALGTFLSKDTGEPVSLDQPAAAGSTVTIYATGLGQTYPSMSIDQVPEAPAPTLHPVRIRIGGRVITPLYAGAATNLDGALQEIEFQVPADIGTGGIQAVTAVVEDTISPPVMLALPSCVTSVGNPVSAGQDGTVQSVTVTAPAGCKWQVYSNTNWIQAYPLSGTGTQTVSVQAFPNFSTEERSSNLYAGLKSTSVVQTGDPSASAIRYVRMLYFAAFGRLPQPGEAAQHVQALTAGAITPAALAANFINTAEFNLGARFVAGLYAGLLDRDPEFGGWQFQRDALVRGIVTPDSLVANFLNSQEFLTRFGVLDDRAFASLLYRNILQRTPAATEVDFQAGALKAGVSRVQLALAFLNTAEFRVRTGPRLSAFLLYALLLQRDADEQERSRHIDAFSTGGDFQTLASELLASPEFRRLVN